MRKLQRLLSIFMCAVLCIGMAIPAVAVSAAVPQKGGDPLSGIASSDYNVWRYDSAESLGGVSATINTYVTKDGTRTTEMKYTVDPNYGVKCASTVYEPVGGALGLGDHRITTAFVGANKLIVDCNYIALTYLTTSTAKWGITFRNTGGAGSVKLTEDTSVSGGKWVTVYAPITEGNKTNMIARLNKSFGNMGIMWDGATGADEALFVREVVFFKNKADAKAYAAAAPVCYNGDAYVAPEDEPEEEEDETVDVSAARGEIVQDGNKIIYDSYDPFEVIDPKSYNIWRFDSADSLGNVSATMNAYVDKKGVRTEETQFTVDPYYGVKCAVTVYEPVGGLVGLGNHRMTAAFVGTNKLAVDCNYIAVTYLTKNSEEFGLVFRNTGGAGSIKLTEDTSASKGKWTTAYAPITDSNKTNIITRMNKSYGNMGLMWEGAKDERHPLYVREIVFFQNEADAALYAEVAPAYYRGEQVVKTLPKTEEQKQKLHLMGAVIAAMRGAKWAVENEKKTTAPLKWIEYEALFDMRSAAALDKTTTLAPETGVVSYVTAKNNEAAKLEFTPGNSELGYYRVTFTPDAVDSIDVDSGNYYAAVTYRSNTRAALTLTAGEDTLTVEDNTVASEKWQTVYVNVEANSDILSALASGNEKITLAWGHDAPSGSIEIKELVFFSYEFRAKDYEKYAPGYYNGLLDWKPRDPLAEIDGEIVIGFSSVNALKSMLNLKDTPNTVMADIEKDGIAAVQLSCDDEAQTTSRRFTFVAQPLFKAKLDPNNAGGYYAAITFMADGEGDIQMYRHAGGGSVFGTAVASDKWQTLVCGGPLNSAMVGTLADPTNYGSQFSFVWNNTEADTSIIVKEIVIFDNPEDAVKYGENAAEYYNYVAGYEKIDAPDGMGAPEAPLSGLSNYDKWNYATADALAEDGASLNRNAMADTAVFAKDPNFGVKSLKLTYSTKSNVNTYWSQTQFNIGGNKLLVTPNYIAITYLTSDTAEANISFNTMTSGGYGVIVGDTSGSNGRWATGYLALNDDQVAAVAARLSGGGKALAINWSNTKTNSAIYIREVVFFENEADVKAYAEKAPAYYNYAEDYSWNVEPLSGIDTSDYRMWCYESATALSTWNAVMQGGTYSYVSDPATGVGAIAPAHDGTSYAVNSKFNGGNWIARFGIDLNYIAVTYKTPGTAKVGMRFWAYNGASTSITSDTSVSGGKWVTEYVKIEGNNKDLTVSRLNQPNHFFLTWDNTAADQSIYIREILFFENEADVKSYAAKAPVYYNYSK